MNIEFCEDRLNAAGALAQTMIVVDDKATLAKEDESVPEGVVQPGRGHRLAAAEDDASAPQDITHLLDAKSLVDCAMDIGLVCSVLNFRENESKEDLSRRISNAAMRVDIVCLDWEINNDSGETTRLLIEKIVRHDQEQNGRLRLIAIYTGEPNRRKILQDVKKHFTKSDQSRMKLEITEDGREIRSATGLKIVCLFKKHGTTLTADLVEDQVSEAELPKRLLKEFSTLSEGLLSNVALGTIARIRDVTHQIIGSFSGDMDGPYFHHRATISNPGEAENYAVNIVLSRLTSAIKLQNIGRDLAGEKAIKQRVESFADENKKLQFQYERGGKVIPEDINADDVIRMIIDGYECRFKTISFKQRPSDSNFKKCFTSLFSSNPDEADMLMKKFAVLTSIHSHPSSYSETQQTSLPELGLGTIIQAPSNQHLLCLQPSCDSVRLDDKQMFLFVLLEEKNDKPDHIVPCRTADKTNFIGLKVPDKGYTRVITLKFNPDSTTKTVLAERDEINDGMFFEGANGVRFRWIAQLKQRPALRTVNKIGQKMSRLGFDEFEPFRS